LIISGESGIFTTPSGKPGAMLRAYDKATGKGAGAVYMPQGETGTPMTNMMGGQQYNVLAIGGPGFPAEFIAYKLPRVLPVLTARQLSLIVLTKRSARAIRTNEWRG
jgi:hypothetical protein